MKTEKRSNLFICMEVKGKCGS